MRPTDCPFCSSDTEEYLSTTDVNRRTSDTTYYVRRCRSCGLMFVANPPVDLTPYYTSDYHLIPKNRHELDKHLPRQAFKIKLLKRFQQRGRLLEIGPSIGTFCALAKDAGFEVDAIEMDRACVAYLNTHVGVNATLSDNPATVLAHRERHYEAICLWHALEHMRAPWEVLAQAAKSLVPGGVLVIAVPNPTGKQARLMGANWPHWDLPRHLFHFPMGWLEDRCRSLGLEHEFITTRDAGGLYWNRFSWAMRAAPLAPHRRLKPVFWGLGLLFGYLVELRNREEGDGATYTTILRRPFGVPGDY